MADSFTVKCLLSRSLDEQQVPRAANFTTNHSTIQVSMYVPTIGVPVLNTPAMIHIVILGICMVRERKAIATQSDQECTEASSTFCVYSHQTHQNITKKPLHFQRMAYPELHPHHLVRVLSIQKRWNASSNSKCKDTKQDNRLTEARERRALLSLSLTL